MMVFQMAFELSLGLMLGCFVGYLPFVFIKARMMKSASKNAIDIPANDGGLDMAQLMKFGAQFMGKGQ
jgi:cbb3-type cytochrome oxidase subunit 3